MSGFRLRRWTDLDYEVLVASNTPAMMTHLAGPETPERVRRRHEQYLRFWDAGGPRMFAVVDAAGVACGSVGWWTSSHAGEDVSEAGWAVPSAFQGRGVATAGLRLLVEDARAHAEHRRLMAFPNVENVASNALCRTVGFTRHGTFQDEYRGVAMELAVWELDLDGSHDA